MEKEFHKALFNLLGSHGKIVFNSNNEILYKGFHLKDEEYTPMLSGLIIEYKEELEKVSQAHIFYELIYDLFNETRFLEIYHAKVLSKKIDISIFVFEGNITDELKEMLVKNYQKELKKIFAYECAMINSIAYQTNNAYNKFSFRNETGSNEFLNGSKLTFVGNQNTLIYFLWSLYKAKKFKFPDKNERQDFEKYIAKNFNYSKNYLDIPTDINFPANVISKFLEKLPHKKYFITKPPQKTKDLIFILETMKSEISGMIEDIKKTDLREEEFEQ